MLCLAWNFYNLKVSNEEENVVTALALNLVKLYGPKTTISWGKIHEYLGMDIDWASMPGTMIVYMIKYLQKVIEEFPEVLRRKGLHHPAIIYLTFEKRQARK